MYYVVCLRLCCIDVCHSLLNFLFSIVTLAHQVAAAAFIVIGSILAADNPTIEYGAIFDDDFHTEVWDTSIYMTITLGCIIAGIAFAGFCGVRRESTFLLFLVSAPLMLFHCAQTPNVFYDIILRVSVLKCVYFLA